MVSKCFVTFLLFTELTLAHRATGSEIADFSVEGGKLRIESGAIRLLASLPHIDIQYNDGEQPRRWTPASAPEVLHKIETTPLGKAAVTSHIWRDRGSYQLQYDVLELDDQPSVVLRASFHNESAKPVRLERFTLLDVRMGNLKFQGEPEDWTLSSNRLPTATFETLDTMQKRQLLTPGAPFRLRCEDVATWYTNAGKVGLLVGGLEDLADVYGTTAVDNQGSCQLQITSEMTQVLVEPGESRESERVLLSLQPWREATRSRAQWITSVNPPQPTIDPLFGWCSWYSVFMNVNENVVTRVCNEVHAHRGRLPMDVVQVDEGWQVGRHDWRPNQKFPQGMATLAKKIESTGAMPGIWLSLVRPSSKRLFDGKVHDLKPYGGGELIRTFDEEWYEGYLEGKPNFELLDPTHPAVQKYIRATLQRLVEDGYRYFKLDFNDLSGEFKRRYDPKMTRFQAQRQLFRLYREAIGPDSYLMLCTAEPFRVGVGYGNSCRIGTDTETRRGFLPGYDQFGNPSQGHGLYYAILQTVASCADNGLLMAGDPDVTYVALSRK